jgi:uncharacterized membrane protein
MSLVPDWAPNVHPLVIHFPIVLVLCAAVVDLAGAVFERPSWLGDAATALVVAGACAAIAAYVTGLAASSTVFIPGMAHPAVMVHRNWAFATMSFLGVVAVLRLAARRAGLTRTRRHRLILLSLSVAGALLVQQTAERGARLVYEYGVGVIAAPGAQ